MFKIVGVFHDYFELKPIRPRLLALRNFLKLKPYEGVELEEHDQSGDGYFDTMKLLNYVQASEEELEEALRETDAFLVNGTYHLTITRYYSFL